MCVCVKERGRERKRERERETRRDIKQDGTIKEKKILFAKKPIQGLYHKTLLIRNLQKMNRHFSKQASFLLLVTFTGMDKHTSVSLLGIRGRIHKTSFS